MVHFYGTDYRSHTVWLSTPPLVLCRELYPLRFVQRVGTLCAISACLIGGYKDSDSCWKSAGALCEQNGWLT